MFVVRQLCFEQIYGNVLTAALTAHALPDRHLSLVTVAWLIQISNEAMKVAYFFLIYNRTGRDGWRRTTGCLAGEEGLTQLMC